MNYYQEENSELKTKIESEFIDKIDNPTPIEQPKNGFLSKFFSNKVVLFGMIGFISIIIIIILISVISNYGNKKYKAFNKLYSTVSTISTIGEKYQDLIDNVNVRSQSHNFQTALTTVKFSMDSYKTKLTKEERQKFSAEVDDDQNIELILDRLEKAYLNETLDRIYLNEMILLLNQLEAEASKLSKYKYDDNFNQSIVVFRQNIYKIKQQIEKTILED